MSTITNNTSNGKKEGTMGWYKEEVKRILGTANALRASIEANLKDRKMFKEGLQYKSTGDWKVIYEHVLPLDTTQVVSKPTGVRAKPAQSTMSNISISMSVLNRDTPVDANENLADIKKAVLKSSEVDDDTKSRITALGPLHTRNKAAREAFVDLLNGGAPEVVSRPAAVPAAPAAPAIPEDEEGFMDTDESFGECNNVAPQPPPVRPTRSVSQAPSEAFTLANHSGTDMSSMQRALSNKTVKQLVEIMNKYDMHIRGYTTMNKEKLALAVADELQLQQQMKSLQV